ncbi:MAG: 8-oxo-dGTP diphosphatase [Frankiaceae bacterium]|nr:8-oxo-dGTP diphosphatase [Frankiaceae bacterium]
MSPLLPQVLLDDAAADRPAVGDGPLDHRVALDDDAAPDGLATGPPTECEHGNADNQSKQEQNEYGDHRGNPFPYSQAMSSPTSADGNGSGRVACVGGVAHDRAGRVLLVLRGRDPGAGLWSIPGGRVEAGETPEGAVAREMREETGLDVVVGRALGSVQLGDYDITDYACEVVGGALQAGDDAVACRWVSRSELSDLAVVDGVAQFLGAL